MKKVQQTTAWFTHPSRTRIDFAKVMMIALALIAFIFAGYVVHNNQVFKAKQTKEAQQSVLNHTQTLNEIDSVVTQIKNNQFNNSTALEDFIRNGLVCVGAHPLPLQPTADQIQAEANLCFPDSPQIK